jgi:hypothetical protein
LRDLTTNHKKRNIMRLLFAFLCCLPIVMSAQNSAYELFDCEEDDERIQLQAAEYTSIIDSFQRSVRLYQDQSSVTILTENIKQIRCMMSLPRLGDNFSIIIEKRRLQKEANWEQIHINNYGQKQQSPSYIFSEVISNTAASLGKTELRFRLVYPKQGGSGNLYIDNIQIVQLSDKEVMDLKQEQLAAERMEDIRQELNFVGKANCKSIAENYNILQKEYLNGLDKVRMIAYRASMIELISNISLYTGQRGQMGNPITYAEFQSVLDSIGMNADSIGRNLLKDFSMQMDSLMLKKIGSNANGDQNVFGKIFSIAGNIANVITAGRIDNIVNSIKGVVATIFNRPALENKYVVRDFFMHKRKEAMRRLDANRKKVEIELEKGMRHVNQLNDFLAVAQKENNAFLNELNSSSIILQEASNLSDDVDKFIENYLMDVDINLKEDMEEFYKKMNTIDSKTRDELNQKVENYFKNKMPNCQSVSMLSLHHADLMTLEQLNSNIMELDLVYNRYLMLIDRLKNHYEALQSSICHRKNPFDQKQYPKSYQKYEDLRKAACKSLKSINQHLSVLLPSE